MISKVRRYLRQHGAQAMLRRLACEARQAIHGPLRFKDQRHRLEEILAIHEGQTPLIFLPLLDWDGPLRQRPHHIALSLGELGLPYFFVTANGIRCRLGLWQAGDGCYVTHDLELLYRHLPDAILHIYSTTYAPLQNVALEHLRRGGRVLYEYMDEIHPDLSGGPVSDTALECHHAFLRDRRVLVVATADRLWKEVLLERGTAENIALIPNGADVEHFSRAALRPVSRQEDKGGDAGPTLLSSLRSGRSVLGYFGALASWFDYRLVRRLAQSKPECEIVLLGCDYDGSFMRSGLGELPNVHAPGPIDYARLPDFAARFDVALIPFVINEITLSTSPIKLYEYLAAGLPVVTTDLPECRKLSPVLVAESHSRFLTLVDRALELGRDLAYRQSLRQVAANHSWQARAREIARLLKAD